MCVWGFFFFSTMEIVQKSQVDLESGFTQKVSREIGKSKNDRNEDHNNGDGKQKGAVVQEIRAPQRGEKEMRSNWQFSRDLILYNREYTKTKKENCIAIKKVQQKENCARTHQEFYCAFIWGVKGRMEEQLAESESVEIQQKFYKTFAYMS